MQINVETHLPFSSLPFRYILKMNSLSSLSEAKNPSVTGPCKDTGVAYVQSFYLGFPDGGSIIVDACCATHRQKAILKQRRPSWHKHEQLTMEEDSRLRSNNPAFVNMYTQ